MSQTPANGKELWELYKIGAAGLDVLAMIVKETDDVLTGDLDPDMPKTQSNLAAAIQNAIVRSSSGIPKLQDTTQTAKKATDDEIDGKISGDTPTESLKKRSTNISVREIYMICPMLAAFSNRISDYFQAYPIPLESSALNPDAVVVSLKDFQKQCADFQNSCTIDPSAYPPEQERLLKRIFSTLQQIIDFPKGPETTMPKLESLEILLTATERILEKLPRYENQTGVMSAKNREKLSKTQVLVFVERLMRDPTQEDPNLPTKKPDDLDETLEKLWKLSKRLERQSYNWTRENDVQLQTSGLQQVIEKGEKRRIEGQDWVNPTIQRNNDMEILSEQISHLPKPIESQIYYPTESKQKQMYLSKIEGHLAKLGRPMMADQRAYSKTEVKNMKFSEVDQILNHLPPRIDSQSAYAHGRPLVERNNSEQELAAIASRKSAAVPETKTVNTTMKERRKSIQSSLGNAIAKLSGAKPISLVNTASEIEKSGSPPPGIQKSNMKKGRGSQDKLADIPAPAADGDSPSKAGFLQKVNLLVSGGTPSAEATDNKRNSFISKRRGSAVVPQAAINENSGEGIISAVQNSQSRYNDQAADGLNIGDQKQRDVINIVHMSAPKMADQRADKRKSYIAAITHSDL